MPLTGFSHGGAGIAWALFDLAATTGEGRFRAAALGAIDYERSQFSPAHGNWPDLRVAEDSTLSAGKGKDSFAMSWCHGAPGIGLGRLLCLEHVDDLQIRSEINSALATTLEHGFGSNHSLCHGDLGNLELLQLAGAMLGERRWRAEAGRLAAIILENIEQNGWLCGNPLGVESPGLMTGLAGIGYALLRLAEPKHVPSILALDAPCSISEQEISEPQLNMSFALAGGAR
jgi:lantibiotic modifying enzyme